MHSGDLRQADSVAARYADHSLENLQLLSYRLTHELSGDILKFRAIFKWVCSNIENDYQLFTENQRKRSNLKDPEALKKWNATLQSRMLETLLKKRSTVCTGYAYLIRELCAFAGINAEIVDGYGRTIGANVGGDGVINHSWTAVSLNGKWYLCDATWASGVINLTHKQFLKQYNDAYFLSDPEYFIRNHFPADTRWTLLNENPTLETFLNRPIIYANAYKYKVLSSSPDKFEIETSEKKLRISIKRDSSDNLPMTLRMDSKPHPMTIFTTETEFGQYTIEFNTRPGRHLVHLLINDEPVFTYAVTRIKH